MTFYTVAQRGSSADDSRPPAAAADDGAPARGAGPDDGGGARRRPVIGEGGDETRAYAKTARGELAPCGAGDRGWRQFGAAWRVLCVELRYSNAMTLSPVLNFNSAPLPRPLWLPRPLPLPRPRPRPVLGPVQHPSPTVWSSWRARALCDENFLGKSQIDITSSD